MSYYLKKLRELLDDELKSLEEDHADGKITDLEYRIFARNLNQNYENDLAEYEQENNEAE